MSDIVLVAVITGLFASITSIITAVASSRLMSHRINELEKKMDKHNSLVERIAVAEQSIKSAHHRIDDL